MKSKITGVGFFLAGFAVAMVIIGFQGRIRPALAGQCWMDAAKAKIHDHSPSNPDDNGRFAISYKVPQCILGEGYTVFNAKFRKPNEFIVVYKK